MKFLYEKVLVKIKSSYQRRMPVNLDKDGVEHYSRNKEYTCPNLYVYIFKKINLLPDGTLFWVVFPLEISFPFFRGRLKHHNIKGMFTIRTSWKGIALNNSRNYLVIHDPWTKNYYHWITQALPRLLLVKKLNINFTLLLPEDHDSNFHKRTLEILGIHNWVSLNRSRNYFKMAGLIYPSHDIQIGDYSDILIKELASCFMKPNEVENTKLLFIHRASKESRRILNEEAVLNTFTSFGFKVVELEGMSFDEQIELLSRSSIIAGVHGAGLTNMIFMPEGGKVFELTTRLEGDQYYYFTLSNALNHTYYYQLCLSDDHKKTIQRANLRVDIKKLEENLELMLNDCG